MMATNTLHPQLAQITGVLTSVSIYNDWGRGYVRLEDQTYMTITGSALVGLTEGVSYRFDGRYLTHPKYGQQFECAAASIDIPLHEDAITRHLAKNFKGCGKVSARKMVKLFSGNLEELRDLIVNNPFAIDFSLVTSRKVEPPEGEDLSTLIYRDLSTRLGLSGVRDSVLRKIAKWLHGQVETAGNPVKAAWSLFSGDPYMPIKFVSGYGFAAADGIALKFLNFPRFHDYRVAAMVTYALREACEQNGHTYLTIDEIGVRIAEIDVDVDVIHAIAAAEARCEPITAENHRYYPNHLLTAEKRLAHALAHRIFGNGDPITDMTDDLLKHEIRMAEKMLSSPEKPFELDDSQRKAVTGMLHARCQLHTLTGPPGCGKTALMEVLVSVARNKKIRFCAPTGKASKVLSNRVKRFGQIATTIHALLEVTLDGFEYNAHNQLDVDIVIIDETSMLDLELACALMEAIPLHAHIIFLGDVDQLSSVGPGQFLANLLQIGFDHHRLSSTHRNDGGILEVVQQAGRGYADCVDRPDVRFSHGLPEPDDVGMSRVIASYHAAIKRHGIDRVGLLMPRRKGDRETPGWNVTYCNEILRQELNPDGCKIIGSQLHVNDRIIIRQNEVLKQGEDEKGKPIYEQVVNGDTGFIREVFLDQDSNSVSHLILELDDGRQIRYPSASMSALNLAYAITVHSSQGSEYDVVIFMCTNGSPNFVHRGIAYTAFSRAKKTLLVYGDDNAVRSIVRREIPKRNSVLSQRTQSYVNRLAA